MQQLAVALFPPRMDIWEPQQLYFWIPHHRHRPVHRISRRHVRHRSINSTHRFTRIPASNSSNNNSNNNNSSNNNCHCHCQHHPVYSRTPWARQRIMDWELVWMISIVVAWQPLALGPPAAVPAIVISTAHMTPYWVPTISYRRMIRPRIGCIRVDDELCQMAASCLHHPISRISSIRRCRIGRGGCNTQHTLYTYSTHCYTNCYTFANFAGVSAMVHRDTRATITRRSTKAKASLRSTARHWSTRSVRRSMKPSQKVNYLMQMQMNWTKWTIPANYRFQKPKKNKS